MMKAALVAALTVAASGAAEAGTVTASCTVDGVAIYRERFPAQEAEARRARIRSLNPDALCVFLDSGNRQGRFPDPLAIADGTTDPGGLAAALAAIAGGSVGEKYPPDAVRAMERAILESTGQPAEKEAGSVSLVLGVYKSVPFDGVIGHWKDMQRSGGVLSKFTPTVSTLGDVTVLSVENVPDGMASEACKEAEAAGGGCVSAY